jgi:hypothetical protein
MKISEILYLYSLETAQTKNSKKQAEQFLKGLEVENTELKPTKKGTIKLYHHKTDGGAEYLTDKFIKWSFNGKRGKEGIFQGANYIVRIDGDITKDAELTIR